MYNREDNRKFSKFLISFVYLYLQYLDRLAQLSLKLVCVGAFVTNSNTRSHIPYSLWEVHGFFNIPSANRGYRFRTNSLSSPSRSPEWLIICGFHSKGSTFSSVILRPSVGPVWGFNLQLSISHGSLALYNMANQASLITWRAQSDLGMAKF